MMSCAQQIFDCGFDFDFHMFLVNHLGVAFYQGILKNLSDSSIKFVFLYICWVYDCR